MAFSIAIVLLVLMFGGGRKRTKKSASKGAHVASSSSTAETPSTYRAYYDDTPTRLGYNEYSQRPAGIFRTDEALSRHENVFINCPVMGERSITIGDFRNSLVARVIRNRGWENLTSYSTHPNITVVKEFYANIDLNFVESDYIHCFVRTKFFHITPRKLSTYFNVPVVENPQFPFSPDNKPSLSTVASLLTGVERQWDGIASTLKHSELTQDFAVLHIFVSANIFPVSHTTHVNKDKAFIMYALAQDVSMDLGSYIFKLIVNAFENPKKIGSLPFGSLITSLCRSVQVQENANDIIGSLGATYNAASLHKRLSNINRVRREIPNVGVDNIPGENVEAHPVPPPQGVHSMEEMWNLMYGMNERMNSFYGEFGSFQEEVRENNRSNVLRLDRIDHRLANMHLYGGSSSGHGNLGDDNDGNDGMDG